MTAHFELDLESIPHTWRGALSETPAAYRRALLEFTRKSISSLGSSGTPAQGSIGHDLAVEFSGLSTIQFSAFIPFHLVALGSHDEMITLMAREGPDAVMGRIDTARFQKALIVGDATPNSDFENELERLRRSLSISRFVAGPGPDIEPALRAYTSKHEIPRAFLGTADMSGGANWSSPPGPLLDTLIADLFEQHRPDCVIVFEPARLPSTLFTIDMARQNGLHLELVEPSAVR